MTIKARASRPKAALPMGRSATFAAEPPKIGALA